MSSTCWDSLVNGQVHVSPSHLENHHYHHSKASIPSASHESCINLLSCDELPSLCITHLSWNYNLTSLSSPAAKTPRSCPASESRPRCSSLVSLVSGGSGSICLSSPQQNILTREKYYLAATNQSLARCRRAPEWGLEVSDLSKETPFPSSAEQESTSLAPHVSLDDFWHLYPSSPVLVFFTHFFFILISHVLLYCVTFSLNNVAGFPPMYCTCILTCC